VKEQVEGKTNASYETFVAVSYCTQLVAGTNFFIKVSIFLETNQGFFF